MEKVRTDRVAELDAIRALAAFAVILYHARPNTGIKLIDFTGSMGWTAVDLFFLLSGYLITGIILKYQVNRDFLVAFYARRALRIWPIYYLSVVGLFLFSRSGLAPQSLPIFTTRAFCHYATFTQDITRYWGVDYPSSYLPIGHFWSLAVEEQFYLVWPFLILLFSRRKVAPLALAFIATAILFRDCFRLPTRYVLLTRCDALGLGALLAVVINRESFTRDRSSYVIAFASIAALAFASIGFLRLTVARSLFEANPTVLLFLNPAFFGLVGLVICYAGTSWLAPLRSRPLCYLGQISYGLYLYHYLIFNIVDASLGLEHGRLRELPFKLALTFVVSIVSWEFLEKPALSCKGRFSYGSTVPVDSTLIDPMDHETPPPWLPSPTSEVTVPESTSA